MDRKEISFNPFTSYRKQQKRTPNGVLFCWCEKRDWILRPRLLQSLSKASLRACALLTPKGVRTPVWTALSPRLRLEKGKPIARHKAVLYTGAKFTTNRSSPLCKIRTTKKHRCNSIGVFLWCEKRDLILRPRRPPVRTALDIPRMSIHSRPFKSLTPYRKQQKRTPNGVLFCWCEKRDLNPYGVTHTPLTRARMPVTSLARNAAIFQPLDY